MKYICHSGGSPGSDMMWENEGNKYGVHTISYSFYNHHQYGENQKILTVDELNEGFEAVMRANETLKRYPQGQPQYIKNLLARNWFQVKNSDTIFAIGKFQSDKIVSGGTGWAIQMAIDNNKPIYVFDQENKIWVTFIYSFGIFSPYSNEFPILTENFAGIGTREINENGKQAIIEIYKHNFKNINVKPDDDLN